MLLPFQRLLIRLILLRINIEKKDCLTTARSLAYLLQKKKDGFFKRIRLSWDLRDLNPEPAGYESAALTN